MKQWYGFITAGRVVAGCAAICLLFLATACSEKSNEPPLRIASSPWPGYEPLYLARDLGHFDAGKISLFELPSSDITMESFRNRSTDIATLTLDETFGLLHDGVKLRVLLVMDVSHGGDAVLVRPEIKNLPDLKGKRISIVNIPLGLYMLNRTLDVAGLERDDVLVFPMAESRQEEFYRQGQADAVISFEPVKTRLLNAGAQVLFDSSRIPNEIFDLLVIHEDVYLQRYDDVCHMVRQWFKTLDYMRAQHDDTARRVSKRLNMNVEDYDDMMAGIILPSRSDNQRLLGGKQPEILQPAQRLQDIMLREKMLSRPLDLNSLFDPDFAGCYTQ